MQARRVKSFLIPRYRWRSTGRDGGAQARDHGLSKGDPISVLPSHRGGDAGWVNSIYINGEIVLSIEGNDATERYEQAKRVAAAIAIAESLGWRRPDLGEYCGDDPVLTALTKQGDPLR